MLVIDKTSLLIQLVEIGSPEIAAEVGGEEAVDEWIGCRVERRQTLDERRHGRHRLGAGDVTVHLQQIENDVRRPAQDENCKIINK